MQILVLGVWKTVCCLENGGSMLVTSLCVLLRLVLNQGQHPWESNSEGVIWSCCHSSVENGEGKCTCGFSVACLPLVQAFTKGERVIRKSSGWGVSVLQSRLVFFLLFFHSFIPFMGRLVVGFFVMSCLFSVQYTSPITLKV